MLDSRYFPTCVKKTGKEPCKKGAIADKKLKETYKGIFLVKSVLCTVNCDICTKPHVVYFLKKPKDSEEHEKIIDQIRIECEQKLYICRYPLITNKASTIYNKVFAKERNTCPTDIENQYFNQLVKKHFYAPVCVECGS